MIDMAQGGFWSGIALLVLGVADGAFNVLNFAGPPEFLAAGVALVVASQSVKK